MLFPALNITSSADRKFKILECFLNKLDLPNLQEQYKGLYLCFLENEHLHNWALRNFQMPKSKIYIKYTLEKCDPCPNCNKMPASLKLFSCQHSVCNECYETINSVCPTCKNVVVYDITEIVPVRIVC